MSDEPGRDSLEIPQQEGPWTTAGKTRRSFRQLRSFSLLILTLGHLAFFLPLRTFIPFPPEADPWWGLALVLADGAACGMLIRFVIKKVRKSMPTIHKEES